MFQCSQPETWLASQMDTRPNFKKYQILRIIISYENHTLTQYSNERWEQRWKCNNYIWKVHAYFLFVTKVLVHPNHPTMHECLMFNDHCFFANPLILVYGYTQQACYALLYSVLHNKDICMHNFLCNYTTVSIRDG